MKLLLIILGITLCTALPSFRGLQDTTVAEDIDTGDDFPKWLFADVAVTASGEEDLSGVAQEEEQLENNEEEALPPQEETLLDQIRNDPTLNDVFNFGVGAVISGGITKGKIPSTTFIVADVSDMATNTSKAGVRYLFSCVVASKDGDSVINMNFTVYYAFSNQQKSLRAFSYVIKTTTPFTIDESKYTTVSQEEVDTNSVIKEGLEYAIDEVVNQADQYSVSEIKSVQTQTVKTTVYYKYNVELTNNKDKTVNLVTTVAYHPDTGKMKVESYSTTTTTTTVTTTTTTTTSPRK